MPSKQVNRQENAGVQPSSCPTPAHLAAQQAPEVRRDAAVRDVQQQALVLPMRRCCLPRWCRSGRRSQVAELDECHLPRGHPRLVCHPPLQVGRQEQAPSAVSQRAASR